MKNARGHTVIRPATAEDALQIAEILVEDWKMAYRGIIDSAYLDSMSVEQRYQREARRYRQYTVAADGNEILGFAWNALIDGEEADCEIVALYVRYAKRKSGTGRALFLHSMDTFRAAGSMKPVRGGWRIQPRSTVITSIKPTRSKMATMYSFT